MIGDDIWVDRGASTFRCAHCGEELGALSEHSKQKLVVRERPLEEVGERFQDPTIWVDAEIIFRELFCPGCATRLATEVCRPDDEVLIDLRLNGS